MAVFLQKPNICEFEGYFFFWYSNLQKKRLLEKIIVLCILGKVFVEKLINRQFKGYQHIVQGRVGGGTFLLNSPM